MSDPAWFPSAAMQTIGAMYAIFFAVYVLALREPKLQKEFGETLLLWFKALSLFVFTSLFVNSFILYAFSVGYIKEGFKQFNFICFFVSMAAIFIIILYSYGLVRAILGAKK